VHGIRRWWNQPDHYDWLSGYLAARHLTVVCRCLLAVSMAVLGAALGLMLWSPSGPQSAVSRAAVVVIVAGLAAMAVVYAVRWPSRRVSFAFSALGSVAIAVAALAETDPLSGLLTCAAFAGLAGYVAFFHGARLLLWTLVVAVITATVCSTQIALAGDVAMAVSKLLLVSGGLLAVPVCGQALVSWLWVDATKSSTDTLTGLANRRGFRRAAHDLLGGAVGRDGRHFSVVMIDLDGFKRLNDQYGHATGDSVLVDVADCMRRVGGDTTALARVGGEEFLVAEVVSGSEIDVTAERIRAAIASTEWGVTASLGVASVALTASIGSYSETIDGLVSAADKAMYEAKRAGGNQVCRI
jgi:diguanylate cyclase (GGDEF)-like protein